MLPLLGEKKSHRNSVTIATELQCDSKAKWGLSPGAGPSRGHSGRELTSLSRPFLLGWEGPVSPWQQALTSFQGPNRDDPFWQGRETEAERGECIHQRAPGVHLWCLTGLFNKDWMQQALCPSTWSESEVAAWVRPLLPFILMLIPQNYCLRRCPALNSVPITS